MSQNNLLQTIYDNEADLLEKVRIHVDNGADINTVTKYGESALRVASNNGRFDVVKLLLDSGAEKAQLGWTASFFEVAFGTLESLKDSIAKHNDLEARDYWQRTPWLLSIQHGCIDKAMLLLDLGTDRTACGRCGKQPIAYVIEQNNLAMLQWLVEQDFDIEATDEFLNTPLIIASELGQTDCVKYLLNQGADIYRENHIPERAIQVAANLEVVQALVEQGDDINDLNQEAHVQLLGVLTDGTPEISRQDFLAGWRRRFGTTNPEKANDKFWIEMIKCGASAWRAKSTYSNSERYVESPIWCYQRYGRSTTILGNGHIVEVGGEHEDYYDPDFCIYNDVVVFDRQGTIDIFTYPKDEFPPTDFHSATLLNKQIVLIGNLGYPAIRRMSETQVLCLDLETWQVKRVATTGSCPGWLHSHKAKLTDDGQGIVVTGGKIDRCDDNDLLENIDDWRLDLRTWNWQRLTQRHWVRFELYRHDRRPNHLWQLRHIIWSQQNGVDKQKEQINELQQTLGALHLDLVPTLYQPSLAHKQVSTIGHEHRILVNGVRVRFVENNFSIQVTIEGELPADIIEGIKNELQEKFALIEQSSIICRWIESN